jgi:SAM-dependent methyltransferase
MGVKVPNPLSRLHSTAPAFGVPGEGGEQVRAAPAKGLLASFSLSFWGVPSGPVCWVGARLLPFVGGRFYPLTIERLDLRPEDELLDVGCGAGLLLEQATVARYVAGLDASEIQLGLARRRLADRLAAGTAELVLGDAAVLPWEDNRFSAVASLNCLKFLPDPDAGLRAMLRVLRPGGRALVMIDPPVKDPARSGAIDAFGERLWSAEDAHAMMRRAGFVDVSVTQLPAKLLKMQLLRGVKP